MEVNSPQLTSIHNKWAPYWAGGLVVLCTTGLATIWIDGSTFWKEYVLDMVGRAWNYILFRGRFIAKADNRWTRFFTPKRTVVIFIALCFGIETSQYFHLYDATFDPWDFPAYISILIPLFILDLHLEKTEILQFITKGELMYQRSILVIFSVSVTLQAFTACSWNLDVVDYTPLSRDNWEVSTPAEQGLDSALIAELYFNAAKVKTTVCWLSKMVT